MQIGFERNSYTVEEGDKSVTVCAEVIAGTATVPVSVTLVTVDIESAQGTCTLAISYVGCYNVTWMRSDYH